MPSGLDFADRGDRICVLQLQELREEFVHAVTLFEVFAQCLSSL